MKKFSFVSLLLVISSLAFSACPTTDLSGDCFVDYYDFVLMQDQWISRFDHSFLSLMASQWLTEGVPASPEVMIWVDIYDPGRPFLEDFDAEMSKYETTVAQYCGFLNDALASGDIEVDSEASYVNGASGSNSGADFVGLSYFLTSTSDPESQIEYIDGVFIVRSRDGYDMSNHPVGDVTWYGATAFCNYYGYWLPTIYQWQAVADYVDRAYAYGCGLTIDHSKANYYFENPLGLTDYPYTTPVDYYPSYGYGLNDLAGNVVEWTSSESGTSRVFVGGGWGSTDSDCYVSSSNYNSPTSAISYLGFRVCRDRN